jgi:tetratricopeptide (TPR) repeat protein
MHLSSLFLGLLVISPHSGLVSSSWKAPGHLPEMILGIPATTVYFQSTFTLIGSVRDQKGLTVSGVRVSIVDENFQPIYTAFVDGSGRFTVKGVKQGRFTIKIETTGTQYQEQSQSLELQSIRQLGGNETYNVDFILKFKVGNTSGRAGAVFAQDVPKPALKEYENALKNLKSNKADQAITELKKAVEIFPEYYDALELLGVEYLKKGQYDSAIPLFTHALEINKRGTKCVYGLGVAHLRLNHLNDAVEWLEKSALADPISVNTQMMLGLAYGTGGAFEKSEIALKKALQLGGASAAEAHYYLAGLYNKLQKYHEAVLELDAYLKDGKDLKDPAQIKAMIEKLKEKLKTTESVAPQLNSPPQKVTQVLESGVTPTITEAKPVTEETKPLIFPSVPPLPPEYVEIIKLSAQNGGLMHRKLLDYTYLLKKTKRTLNDHGKSVGTDENVYEAYPIRGEHVLIKLSHNGIAAKNISDERKRAVKDLEVADHVPANQNTSKDNAETYLAAGISGIFRGKPSYVSIDISTVLKSCEFFSPRLEKIGDRSAVAINFRPRSDMNLAAKHLYMAKIVGTVWFDMEDKVVTHFEGWSASKAAFDLIQATASRSEAVLVYHQERLANGLWFPTLIRLNADGNFDLFDGLNWEVIFEFSGYQKFQTNADDLKVKAADKKP